MTVPPDKMAAVNAALMKRQNRARRRSVMQADRQRVQTQRTAASVPGQLQRMALAYAQRMDAGKARS